MVQGGNFFIIVLAAGLLLVVLVFIFIYNSLVGKKNQIANAEGSIDAMLKKRFDLIPNLVETCTVYLAHEKGIFEQLAELRAKATTGKPDIQQLESIHASASKTVGNLLLMAENYPELKSSNNFLQLQAAWNETEEQIAASRRFYNAAVTDYNDGIMVFPSNIVANLFGFKKREVFVAKESERENISAKNLFGQ
jgi:LemA protein